MQTQKQFNKQNFFGQLKNLDGINADRESMFILTILEKNKETRVKCSQGSVTVL